MPAITTHQEYDAIREAIQQLSTLTSTGARRDFVSISIGESSLSFSGAQMAQLQAREELLAKRLSIRNVRKRVTPRFDGDDGGYP